MIKIPKKFKKQIVEYVKQYEQLGCSKRLRITIPKTSIVAIICWESDDCCCIDEDSIRRFLDSENIYKSKEIIEYNKQIKRFINKTRDFGKKHFKSADWLWMTILWKFRPEYGERFDFKKVEWI